MAASGGLALTDVLSPTLESLSLLPSEGGAYTDMFPYGTRPNIEEALLNPPPILYDLNPFTEAFLANIPLPSHNQADLIHELMVLGLSPADISNYVGVDIGGVAEPSVDFIPSADLGLVKSARRWWRDNPIAHREDFNRLLFGAGLGGGLGLLWDQRDDYEARLHAKEEFEAMQREMEARQAWQALKDIAE